jgi:hypothetical protein
MTIHKATPEQWALLEELSAPEYDSTILELRARIEALEAATPGCPHIATSAEGTSYCRLAEQTATSQPSPNPARIRSSLVERVALAISGIEDSSCWDEEAVSWTPEARAAIREVAACIREHGGTMSNGWAEFLEQKAER